MNKKEIQKMLQHSEQEVVYSFISTYAESNVEFCKQLKDTLMPDRGGDLNMAMYQTKAESCFDFGERSRNNRFFDYYQAAFDAASELDDMLSDADYFIKQGDYAQAAGIAMSVAEVIPRNYENVDDSSGSLGDTFSMATECIVTILHSKQTSKGLKEKIFKWVKTEMEDSVYSDYGFDSLTDVYEAACEEIGETDEVLADLDWQIDNANEYHKEDIVLRKIRFMLSRKLDTNAFIEKYIEIDAVRKIRFYEMEETGFYDEALVLALKGIEIAKTRYPGTVKDWEKSILEIYLKQDNVKNILLQAEKFAGAKC